MPPAYRSLRSTWGVNRNGLRAVTRFFPGILLRKDHRVLAEPAGMLGKRMDDFKACLRTALGIGQGSCLEKGAPAGSLRGRMVNLRTAVAELTGASFAIVLTDAAYSPLRRYQVILPILPGEGRAAAPSVARIPERDWFAVFHPRPSFVLLPIPVVQSVWHTTDIVRETRYVVDAVTLPRSSGACGSTFRFRRFLDTLRSKPTWW